MKKVYFMRVSRKRKDTKQIEYAIFRAIATSLESAFKQTKKIFKSEEITCYHRSTSVKRATIETAYQDLYDDTTQYGYCPNCGKYAWLIDKKGLCLCGTILKAKNIKPLTKSKVSFYEGYWGAEKHAEM